MAELKAFYEQQQVEAQDVARVDYQRVEQMYALPGTPGATEPFDGSYQWLSSAQAEPGR